MPSNRVLGQPGAASVQVCERRGVMLGIIVYTGVREVTREGGWGDVVRELVEKDCVGGVSWWEENGMGWVGRERGG